MCVFPGLAAPLAVSGIAALLMPVFDRPHAQRKELELTEEVESTRKENNDLVAPELKRMEDEIAELREELLRADANVDAHRKTKAELNARVGELKTEKQKASEELAATRIELSKVKSDPDRLRY